jgi:predicted nucleic acid-binding protein
MIAVINASPLIYLSKLGIIEILPQLFTRIVTTRTVKQEVLQEKTAPELAILSEVFNSWLEVESADEKIVKKITELQIHRGEAEVIAIGRGLLAKEKSTVVIIDDLLAREIATSLGLTVTGTIGIILKATKEKIISGKEGQTLLEQLITTTTFRLTARVYAQILKEIEGLSK